MDGIVDSVGCTVGAIVDAHNIGASVLLPAGDGASDVLTSDCAATFCRLASAISPNTDFMCLICNGSGDLLHNIRVLSLRRLGFSRADADAWWLQLISRQS